MVGGDDPDAVPADEDVLGGDAIDPGSEEGPEVARAPPRLLTPSRAADARL